MNISEEIKNAYKSDSYSKILNISFPNINYDVPVDEVYFESMKLDEAIFDSDSFEVVGCIASKFEIQIRDTGHELKGEKIVVSIAIEDIEDSDIPLFCGYIDTVNREAQKKMQSIVAYDALYSKGTVDVADWYNNLSFPITIYDFRNSLFDYLGLVHEDAALPNDMIVINKEYSPNTLQASGVIKAICQINGCFGIINREGVFVYRFLNTSGYIGTTDISEDVSYYRSIDYKDYTVNPVDKLTVRQNTNDVGVTIGDGDNKYIIQGNMFTYNLEVEDILEIALNLYAYLKDIEYIPFQASNNGYPWVEVGENCVLNYEVYDFDNSTGTTDVYVPVKVVAMKRYLHGIQNVIDDYSAEGQELQREFISDISSELDILQQTIEKIAKKMSTEITTYRNPTAINISDGGTATIADIVYDADEGNTVLFHEEVSLVASATESGTSIGDIIASVRYYVNGYRMPNHLSEGAIFDGKHILSLMQFWEAGTAEHNRVQAKLTVEGGSINIPQLQAQAYITVKQSDYNNVSIEVTHEPDKVVYQLGDRLDFTGLIVSKVFSDGSPSVNVTSKCVFSPKEWTEVTSTDMITVGVTYTEINEIGETKTYETEFYLSTKYLIALTVEKEPTKNEYWVGENLNLSGIKVVAEYIDDTIVDVTSQCTYSPNTGHTFASADEGEIAISFTDRGITENTSTFVTVKEVMIEEIKVTHLPNNTTYYMGDTIDYTGLVVKAFYNNGNRVDITNQCTIDPANGSSVTADTSPSALVTYVSGSDEYSTSFDLNIITFDGIEVTSPPAKIAYKVGETLDLSGIVVSGLWSNGSTTDVTAECTFSPNTGATITEDTTLVEIAYTFQGETYEASQEIDVITFEGIEIAQEPNKTKYWTSEIMDYTGLVVEGVWSDDSREDVTADCSIDPESGSVVSEDELTVTVTYPKNGQIYEATFSIECREPEPVLKYLIYTINATDRVIIVTALDVQAIADDQLQNLVIPATYTDPESGITFTIIID